MHAVTASAAAAMATLLVSASVFAASHAAAPVNLGSLSAPVAGSSCQGVSGWYCHPSSGSPSSGSGAAGSGAGSQGSSGSQGSQSQGAASGQGTQGGSASTGSASGLTAGEQQMLSLINQARAAAGLGALTINPTLENLANERAGVMAADNAITHDVPGYGYPAQMEAAAGYVAQASGAEDIAYAGSVSAAWALFRGSAPHWANIVYPAFTQVGIAVAPGSYGVVVDILFSGNPA